MNKLHHLIYRTLRHLIDNQKPNTGQSLKQALISIGEDASDARELADNMISANLIEAIGVTYGDMAVTRVTLNGKMFIENYLGDNSNIRALDKMIETTSLMNAVQSQLQNARKYLVSGDSTDYSTAVVESIKALESILMEVLEDPKVTGGVGVKRLAEEHDFHPASRDALVKLYGFNYDAKGVRHGLKEGDLTPTYAEAKFLVFTYAAFIYYIAEELNLV